MLNLLAHFQFLTLLSISSESYYDYHLVSEHHGFHIDERGAIGEIPNGRHDIKQRIRSNVRSCRLARQRRELRRLGERRRRRGEPLIPDRPR